MVLSKKQTDFKELIDSSLSAQLFEAFSCGIDYGLLIAEEERLNRVLFTSFLGSLHARKTAMPMDDNDIEQPKHHSDKWIKAKRGNVLKFMAMYAYYLSAEKQHI